MNQAVAVSSPLQHGRAEATAAPSPEDRATLGRSLLFIPMLATAAWGVTIGAVGLAWYVLR